MKEKIIIRHNRSCVDIPKLRLGCQFYFYLTSDMYCLPPENYIARFPHVRITFPASLIYQTLQLLDEEKIDLGIPSDGRRSFGDIIFSPFENPRYLCLYTAVSGKSEKALSDEPLIQAATFMMLDEDNITRQTVNTQLKEHHVELSYSEVTTMDLLIQFAEIGLGIECVIRIL